MSGWLMVTVVRGRGFSGGVDLFAQVYVDGKYIGETATQRRNKRPYWNQRFLVPITDARGSLRIDVYDAEITLRHIYIGSFVQDPCENGACGAQWYPLRKVHSPGSRDSASLSGSPKDPSIKKGGNQPSTDGSSTQESDPSGKSNFVARNRGPIVREIYISFARSFSKLAPLLRAPIQPGRLSETDDVEPFEISVLKSNLVRLGSQLYAMCFPYWWLKDRWMWKDPVLSGLYFFASTVALFRGYFLALIGSAIGSHLVREYIQRAREDYHGRKDFGQPAPPPARGNPFAIFSAFEHLQRQLIFVQVTTNTIGDVYERVAGMFLWHSPTQSFKLTMIFFAWFLLSWLEVLPTVNTFMAAINVYLFTLYPLYYHYPLLYQTITSFSFVPVAFQWVRNLVLHGRKSATGKELARKQLLQHVLSHEKDGDDATSDALSEAENSDVDEGMDILKIQESMMGGGEGDKVHVPAPSSQHSSVIGQAVRRSSSLASLTKWRGSIQGEKKNS